MENIHLKPQLIPYLVTKKAFSENNLHVVDVGARGGCEPHWRLYGDQIKLMGIEADAKECNRLNKAEKNKKIRYFNYALWESMEKKPFYMTKYAPGSSFFEPLEEFWSRFPDGEMLNLKKKLLISTITLDEVVKSNFKEGVDFIQLDVEGAELAVLKGAENLLRKSVIGLTLEVALVELHRGQPLFADIDRFLRSLNFEFFDLGLVRLDRKKMSQRVGRAKFGQVVGGHALYFRDGAKEIETGENIKWWNETRVLKLISLMEMYGLLDCADEVVNIASKKGLLKNLDASYIRELLSKSSYFYKRFFLLDFLKKSFFLFWP